MKILRSILLVIYSWSTAIAQEKDNDCGCPLPYNYKGVNKKEYTFGNGKTIVLCGSNELLQHQVAYSEFVLAQCGAKDPIEEWDAIRHCYVHKEKDTLVVDELLYMPIGKGLHFMYTPFFVGKYFYKDQKLIKTTSINKRLPHYTKDQIKSVFAKYRTLKRGNDETTTDVAAMLFWAFVSGDPRAEDYLVPISRKFGPFDGVVAEDWDWLMTDYKRYKELKRLEK